METTHHTTAALKPPRRRRRADEPLPPIVERPDGYYWVGDGTLGEFGPFESYELARADRDAGSEEALEGHDILNDAEREAGLPVLTDPSAGSLDRDGTEPHLHEE